MSSPHPAPPDPAPGAGDGALRETETLPLNSLAGLGDDVGHLLLAVLDAAEAHAQRVRLLLRLESRLRLKISGFMMKKFEKKNLHSPGMRYMFLMFTIENKNIPHSFSPILRSDFKETLNPTNS